MVFDLLIIGHGLAGAVLAETARRRGLHVHVFDRKSPGNASTAAAGMVNPLVLRRNVPSWRAAPLLQEATGFYAGCDRLWGTGAWHPMPLVRLFTTPGEAELWHRSMARADSAPFMASAPDPAVEAARLPSPHGYGTVPMAAWLDVPAFLRVQRSALEVDGHFTARAVEGPEVEPEAGEVSVHGIRGRWLVRCEGPFADVPGLVPVKGDTLTVRIADLQLPCMVHRGVFLLPLGNGLFRTGSTFQWTNVWEGPSPTAAKWILGKLDAFIGRPVELKEHHCGVRPASRDRRPILGVTGPRQAVFNGLGARGVMLAPWCARHLLDHLFGGVPLDPEVDHARFTLG